MKNINTFTHNLTKNSPLPSNFGLIQKDVCLGTSDHQILNSYGISVDTLSDIKSCLIHNLIHANDVVEDENEENDIDYSHKEFDPIRIDFDNAYKWRNLTLLLCLASASVATMLVMLVLYYIVN